MAGTVVISLDFELGWGHKRLRPEYVKKLRRYEPEIERKLDELVTIFDVHDLKATWGVVGKLLEDGDDPLFHNSDVVETVIDSDVAHEIGLHSHAHRPYDTLTRERAREDVTRGIDALARFDVEPTSFIFPRNEIEHADVLAECGFRCYRAGNDRRVSNPIANVVPSIAAPGVGESGLVSVPGSLFLAAPNRPVPLLQLQTSLAMWRAMRSDGLVHFWLHPHNVITRSEVLGLLNRVFSKIEEYRNRGNLEVETMGSIAETYSAGGRKDGK